MQFSIAIRNARLDAVESAIGTAPVLEIRSGVAPASCADADTGTLLAEMALPSDWMAAASGGTKSKAGTWQDPAGNAAGVAGHFRIKQGVTCHIQGTVSMTGEGGEMQLDNTNIAVGQAVTITGFTLTEGNA